ncbi:hypothetical protein Y032_0001g75 [Ancylostoma ceylanicum]|uniref:BPTI/Kunitz inhibitor domain-containing protein n=1 Tax=Ancylostoma ceylanicum TaxID=53326 RepID=A0A016W5V2_9BILA|nr:hypothetical protein Y032_0001g75 [Ancylostoma ceylanicum]
MKVLLVLLALLFCIAMCNARSEMHIFTDEERCAKPIHSGFICENEYSRFTFNAKTKKCEQFTTKLCKEPVNSYDTLEECKRRCMK